MSGAGWPQRHGGRSGDHRPGGWDFGHNAVRSAAYNGRDAIIAERTGELFHFRHRDAPEHHEVLSPEGAATRFQNSGVLWNAAEAAERHTNGHRPP